MKETEYLRATNRVKVSMALTILRDVLPGDDYGITRMDLSEITSRLSRVEEALFCSYELENPDTNAGA